MKPGPPKKPTALKLIAGVSRSRLPKNEPQPLPSRLRAPPDLSDEAKAEWRRVAPLLADLGLLSEIDRAVFTCYCDAVGMLTITRRLLAEEAAREGATDGGMTTRTPNGSTQVSPLVSIVRRARLDVVRFAAEFGMSPASRAGLDVSVPSIPTSTKPQATGPHKYFDD